MTLRQTAALALLLLTAGAGALYLSGLVMEAMLHG